MINAVPLSILITSTGYKRRVLAKKLGVRVRTLDCWISGKKTPNLEQRKLLAKMLRCELGLIHAAVTEQQRRWKDYQEWLAEARGRKLPAKQVIVETIIRIVVSVATAVITSLVILGKI